MNKFICEITLRQIEVFKSQHIGVWTLDLRFMRRVFYHYAAATGTQVLDLKKFTSL